MVQSMQFVLNNYQVALDCMSRIKTEFKCSTSSTKILEFYDEVPEANINQLLKSVRSALVKIGISDEEAAAMVEGIRVSARFFKESDRKGIDGNLKCGYVRILSQKTNGKYYIAISAVVAEAHLGLFRWETAEMREKIVQDLYNAVEYFGSASVYNLLCRICGQHTIARMISL
eukprot:TRINITY_DN16999_c0_g1_i1.p1 TRINITY_DN16999_c0_g1~~TRINITY_DN16999_c0_g1_i1.p1  ORF type:complete len:190 (+),score=9.81 TRINITY_DN16999_c0_g1_i1:52-570(+)